MIISLYSLKKIGQFITQPAEVGDFLPVMLKGMELQIQKEKVAYLPNYIRTKLTDALHEKFGFRTDYEILEYSYLKGLFTF